MLLPPKGNRPIWVGGGAAEGADIKDGQSYELTPAQIRQIIGEMREIAAAEIENARDTIPLVEYDSRLGFEPSMEYMCDRAHLEWKIAMTERALKELVPIYENGQV